MYVTIGIFAITIFIFSFIIYKMYQKNTQKSTEITTIVPMYDSWWDRPWGWGYSGSYWRPSYQHHYRPIRPHPRHQSDSHPIPRPPSRHH